MPATQSPDRDRFATDTRAELSNLWWGLLGLYQVFEQSGIAATAEMEPGNLVRLAAPHVYGPVPDIEISGWLAGLVERTGAPVELIANLLGLAASAVCEIRAESDGA